jgi:hypothetical protein
MRLMLAAAVILVPAYAATAKLPVEGGKPDVTKKICKVDEEDTDSRVRRRICKTEAEWNGKSDETKARPDRSPKQAQ